MQYGILFSGQGAQRSGMGVELMADSLFSTIINQASEISQLDLLAIMKNEDGQLGKTEYVQPALATVSYGLFRMLQRDLPNLPISGIVGLSLGEYPALFASGMLDFTTGLQLLVDRAKYMQADANKIDSTMAAVINPDFSAIEQLFQTYHRQGKRVYVANYNSPSQIVIGGPVADIKAAVEEIKENKLAKRVIVLKVNGAFHTPLFNEARKKMHERLATVDFHDATVPVISNTTVKPFSANTAASILERQLAVPTHFGADLQYLIDQRQITGTLEIGPGKALSRFAKQVDSNLTTKHIAGLTDYEQFIKEHQ